ncbi:MAG: Nif3-like dinuclear metal center hexameric protein, partial [Oscillospiraceae bacterium]|nr:Nif3-like dinuclear metal center hexameric protein [Oscillospiraceae bacterium]
SLDLTFCAIELAKKHGANLIITHHPIMFRGIKQLDSTSIEYAMVTSGISHIAAHTNLDKADGGVNEALANACGLKNPKLMQVTNVIDNKEYGFGLMGEVDKTTPCEYIQKVKKTLGCEGVRVIIGNRPIEKVALNCGGGAFILHDVISSGADAFVSADFKYNDFLDAQDAGLTLIDAGHFETENIIVPQLAKKLSNLISDVEFIYDENAKSVIKYM